MDSEFVHEPANEEISQWRLAEAEGRLLGQIIGLERKNKELKELIGKLEEENLLLKQEVDALSPVVNEYNQLDWADT